MKKNDNTSRGIAEKNSSPLLTKKYREMYRE
jgi:hypothetical protein